jgi:hypothetical protein
MDERTSDRTAVQRSAALERVMAQVGGADIVARLAALSGSDFTSLMLEVVQRRAARETPASVLRRYRNDRFVQPGATVARDIRRVEDALLSGLPSDVELVTLAPLVPLGTHSVLGPVSQHKVITAIRACEVAADPTNGLALAAAVRRAQARASDSRPGTVRLAALQRVVRGQRFGGGYSAHFGLLGLVTAGRDEGSGTFEQSALTGQLSSALRGLTALGMEQTQVALTPLSEAGERIAAAVIGELGSTDAEIVTDRARQAGRGYYRDLCFRVNVLTHGEPQDVGDGGFTDWTGRLTASSKERLLISGLSTDRLAAIRWPAG